MSQLTGVFLAEIFCIGLLWVTSRYFIVKRSLRFWEWIGNIIVGVYAGAGIIWFSQSASIQQQIVDKPISSGAMMLGITVLIGHLIFAVVVFVADQHKQRKDSL